jgi:hypothetical protein
MCPHHLKFYQPRIKIVASSLPPHPRTMSASLGRLELPLPKHPRFPTTVLDASLHYPSPTSSAVFRDDGRAYEQRGRFGTGALPVSNRH